MQDKEHSAEDRRRKPHLCTFEGCTSSFSRPYRLAQHLLHHNNIKAFICNEDGCSKSYTSRSHLERHVNNAHRDYKSEEMIFSCPMCLKIYANRQNLKRHIKIHHYLKVPLSCDNCYMTFKKKHQLLTHMYQHTGIKAFSCEVCSKEFITLLEKKKHMRCHLNKIYACPEAECVTRFGKWSVLQRHLKSVHGVKEYICDSCGRIFKQRSHIVRHVKVHDVKKSFPCPYENCKRLYSRNSNLKQHLLMKHERITHACKICKAHLCTKDKRDEITAAGERVIALYGGNPNTHNLAELRYQQFARAAIKTSFNLARLPPTRDSALFHSLRTYHQVKLNEHLLKCHNSRPFGRKLEKEKETKTKATGRKSRKDIGVLKISTALKLAGLTKTLEKGPTENIIVNVN